MSAFDKIIGYSSIKRELAQICDALKNTDAYERLGVSAPRGLLLHGRPGVGKTLMACALIEECGRRTFTCRKDRPGGDFVKAIRSTFEKAAENAPSIVFLDDMDKFANGDERHPDTEEYITVQSCIDQSSRGVFTLATVNKLRSLPRSLLRAGRFDRLIGIDPPTGKDAVEIIDHYLKSKRFISDIDPKAIARLMGGCSCAEIETVINEAGLYAGFRRADRITTGDFTTACLKTVFNIPESDDVGGNEDDEGDDNGSDVEDGGENVRGKSKAAAHAGLPTCKGAASQVIYHEAGHAVVAEILFPGSVTLVSAHSRGGKRGGLTSKNSSDEPDHLRRIQGDIVISLGGMAALEQKFGIVDVGATSDLTNAFTETRSLVTENCALGFHLYSQDYNDSAALKEKQEQAVVAQIEKYYRKAKEILLLNSELLEKIAAALAEKKLLIAEDIEKIKATCRIVPVAL